MMMLYDHVTWSCDHGQCWKLEQDLISHGIHGV